MHLGNIPHKASELSGRGKNISRKHTLRLFSGFRVEVIGAWMGKDSWNGKKGTESRNLGKRERKIWPIVREMAERDRKKLNTEPGS